ncbi:hypothetical protein ACFO1B_14390 [Dactylosporangium siamense]|uniref:Uncharacterized protein n=1 Tax=Dactylosporangium siamense TaxID=685454 RepID=A0A919PKR2_9ACTN|nr:hypothetical protein [Dactylosporangium siamense]GIG45021.1 hypothetical protein Dsi01nite_030620 [Dactylosporangium siamense]
MKLLEHIRATPNRGAAHIFLGSPLSDGCDKTVAEPGGTFSPGVWTCGISIWVEVDGQRYTPDLLDPDDIACVFTAPVLHSTWPAGPVRVSTALGTLSGPGAEGTDFLAIELSAPAAVHLVVRGEGPAGGTLTAVSWDGRHLHLDGGRRVRPAAPPDGVTIDGDVAVLTWSSTADAGAVVEHAFTDRPLGDLEPLRRAHATTTVHDGLATARERWSGELPARVFAPDPAVAHAWQASAHHLLAQAECGVPRIGAVDYPVLWMRDTVIAVHALDLIGRADLARTACEHLAPVVFSGGFGAESDGPGQGIWVLVEHAVRTADLAWLRRQYPHILERIGWLDRMRTATGPIRALAHNRMPRYLGSPALNVVCLPATDGLIRGRMDWHRPDFYLNCWAVAGYRRAAQAAALLGEHRDAGLWRTTADRLDEAIAEHLLPAYGNERDPIVTPYPTGALAGHGDRLRKAFEEWFRAHRLDHDGGRRPERLWTYFEAAQAHNALRLGLVEEAWASLGPMLRDGGTWQLGAHDEGEPGGNESLPFTGRQGAGWLSAEHGRAGNMPHVWTAAELLGALRTVFVDDDGDVLVLGAGVPESWRRPGARFGATDLPTRWGPITFTVTADQHGQWTADVRTGPLWRLATHLQGR